MPTTTRIRFVAAAISLAFLPSCALFALSAVRQATDAEVRIEQDLRPPPRSRVAEIVERALPTVVNVKSTTLEGRGEGSGVVIDESGIVLTNNHVVQNSVSVRIFFHDGRASVRGDVIGAIPTSDLAVIKIPPGGLTAIEVGSSDRTRLGDEVIAIGYPLGLGGPTVTKGILSGRARTIETQIEGPVGDQVLEIKLDGLLQTDAAINPGNSGGALIDRAGRLVGINTAVAGFAENIGFAIAIDHALPTIEEILNQPPEDHAWLGVQTSPLDPATAQDLGLDPDSEGALVVNVFGGTPADEAGIEQGDVIGSVGGDRIGTPSDLSEAIADHDPGDVVAIELVTAEGERTLRVRLARRPVTLEPFED